MFEDIDDEFIDDEFEDDEFADEDAPAEEAGNRTFLIAVGILGGVTVILILCLGGYLALQNLGGGIGTLRSDQLTQQAQAFEQQTQVARFAQETQAAREATENAPTETPLPTDTPVPTQVIVQATETPSEATADPRTATVAALLTEAAGATAGPTSTAFPTELPDTGFADDVGVTGLLALALLSVVLIFLVRRLRTAGR